MPAPLPMSSPPTMLDDRADAVCCAPLASTAAFPEEDALRLAHRLKALADPTRLRLIAFLLSRPGFEACTCDLAPALGVAESTTSHHLKRLEAAGLVTKQRRGLNVHYAVDAGAIRAIGAALHLGDAAHLVGVPPHLVGVPPHRLDTAACVPPTSAGTCSTD